MGSEMSLAQNRFTGDIFTVGNNRLPTRYAPASKIFVSYEDAQKDPFFPAPNSSWNANREFFNVLRGF